MKVEIRDILDFDKNLVLVSTGKERLLAYELTDEDNLVEICSYDYGQENSAWSIEPMRKVGRKIQLTQERRILLLGYQLSILELEFE